MVLLNGKIMLNVIKGIWLAIIISILSGTAIASTKTPLFPGESMVNVNHYPSLVYFQPGEASKPLVVFIPGMFHLARIGYGIPQTQKKDFLAYWLHQKGYGFLGVSYPLENAVYPQTYPEFSIQDWATQSCSIIHKTVQDNALHPQVIILAWSMAGALARDLSMECAKQNIEIKAFMSLSAVPGNPYIMNTFFTDRLKPDAKGMVSLEPPFVQWLDQSLMQQNKLNHHEIISPQLYRRHFLGEIPVNINASKKRYQDGKFIDDNDAAIKDAGSFDFVNYPWIGLIVDESRSDLKINSIDPYNWYQIMSNRLFLKYIAPVQDKLTPEQNVKIQSIIRTLPMNLTRTVRGSHFFFVGQDGAEQTVDRMENLIQQIESLKKQVMQLRDI